MSDDDEWNPEAGEEKEEQDEDEELPPTPERRVAATPTNKMRKRKRTTATNAPTIPPPSCPSTMIPESLVNYVMTSLQNGSKDEIRETLLRLARIFREQAALCVQQAERLDCLAVEQEEAPEEYMQHALNESYLTKLRRQNVVCFCSKSASAMTDCHEKLDAIEGRLVPWDQKLTEENKVKQKKVKSYGVFSKENYEAFAKRLGTKEMNVVSKEIAKAWAALSEEEKNVYRERANEVNARSQKEQDMQDARKKG